MDFIIQKVNGKDVSGLSHEDALRAFQEAVEPIVVEVKRRSSPLPKDQKRSGTKEEPRRASQCTQTDVSLVGCDWVDDWRLEANCESPEGDYIFPGDLPQSLSQYLEPEIDIEEIIIELPSSEATLGLTLYYTRTHSKDKGNRDASSPIEVDPIEVLVSQIEPGSAAARDGRIRIGDQILQINGEEITSKEQTEKIFKSGGQKTSLVVSRTQCYDEDDLEEGEIVDEFVQGEDNAVLSANSEFTSNSFRPVVGPMSKMSLLENTIEESEEQISASHSVASDDAIISDNSLEKPKLQDPTISSVRSNSPRLTSSQKLDTSTILDFDASPVSSKPAMRRVQPVTNFGVEDGLHRQTSRAANARPPLPPPSCCSDSEHIYESIPSNSETEEEPIYHLPYEPKPPVSGNSNRVRTEGRSTGSSSSSGGSGRSSNKKSSPRKSWTKEQLHHGCPAEERDSSSAYNTGDSNDSKKATLEMCFGLDPELSQSTLSLLPPRRSSQTPPNSSKRDTCDNCCKLDVKAASSRHHRECYESRQQPANNCSGTYVSYVPAQTVYTNQANLGETIWLQQQLFRHALVKRGQATKSGGETERQTIRSQSKLKNESQEKQWRVKIRPDGTRYITHRPARKKMMRDRELKIIEERNGLTTDDDTMSELKRGRYWPREERKKHVEKERERKRQLELRKLSRQAIPSPLIDHPPPSEPDKRWTPVTTSQCFPRPPALPQGPPCNIYLTRTIPHHLMSPHLPYVPVPARLPPPPKGLLSVTTV